MLVDSDSLSVVRARRRRHACHSAMAPPNARPAPPAARIDVLVSEPAAAGDCGGAEVVVGAAPDVVIGGCDPAGGPAIVNV